MYTLFNIKWNPLWFHSIDLSAKSNKKIKYCEIFRLPMPVHCNVNIIAKESKNKERNYKKLKRERKGMVRVEWFRQELLAFLCLCKALKIIIMYIISLGSILKPSRHHIGRKKKLIYFNMHHTSLAHSLCCFEIWKRSELNMQKKDWNQNCLILHFGIAEAKAGNFNLRRSMRTTNALNLRKTN